MSEIWSYSICPPLWMNSVHSFLYCGKSVRPSDLKVAGDNGVSGGIDLHVHVGNLVRLDLSSVVDELRPLLLVLRQIGSPFRQPLCEIVSVVGEVCWKIVGSVGCVHLLFQVEDFFFCRRLLRNTWHTQGQAHNNQQNGKETAVNHCFLHFSFSIRLS